ncbi:aminotransferase class I/II-fold pyridoxal phosphate-dependent enzyme [Acinetobacter larvae]|uniref:Transcriptional regulator PtsJ n=1 Tax=Acinetobacter larvae TaxID=1789224 RepID=A0A1B2M3I0_9GAMM|nr:aminotransferase class I/II-fold pyridoxal phosphate-dependent enzyme [Acinetobacter larvae]AOA59756.1 transcriptional regulator PtsJ [Acinetobacter larvae]
MNIRANSAQDIQDQIRSRIQTGQLQPGDYLPSVRELAEQIGVNRNTVAAAYKSLVAMGLVVSKGRLGTQVKSYSPSRSHEGFQSLDKDHVDLAHGNPKRELLPSLAHIDLSSFQSALYGDSIYHNKLLKYARKKIFSDIPQPFAVDFCHGAVDAIERILTAYLVPSDSIAVEQPGFITSICAIENQQFKMQSFTVSSEGIDLKSLQQALLANVQAILITPRAQNPTGYSLSIAQAQQIKHLLSDYPNVLVLVDDHFSLLSAQPYQHIIPASTKHWAVIRSVSKYLSPDLRFAFVCCDAETSERLHRKLNAGSTWVSHILQEIVYRLINHPQFAKNIQVAQTYYQAQHQQLLQYLQQAKIPCAAQYDGLNIWLALPHAEKIAKVLLQRGWMVRAGQDFKVDQEVAGLRISTADMTEAQMQQFCQQLQQIYEVMVHL